MKRVLIAALAVLIAAGAVAADKPAANKAAALCLSVRDGTDIVATPLTDGDLPIVFDRK